MLTYVIYLSPQEKGVFLTCFTLCSTFNAWGGAWHISARETLADEILGVFTSVLQWYPSTAEWIQDANATLICMRQWGWRRGAWAGGCCLEDETWGSHLGLV